MFWINFVIDVLLAVLIVTCPLMCLVIMMQRSKQEGLGAAFGGGITESVWGAQTSNVLVKATVILAASFFICSIGLARLYAYRTHVLEKPSSLQEQLLKPVAPATTAAGASILPMTATNSSGTPVVPTATPLAPATATPAATNAPDGTNSVSAETTSAPAPAATHVKKKHKSAKPASP
jgi:preprotein translocase subunit SecG